VVNALKNIDKKYKGKTILIVSHGEPLWLLEGAVKNWSITKLLKERQNNFIKTGELRRLSV
jgi:isoleucyl-tRNA synthetase